MSALSVAQVAERWQCSVDAVHDLINAGKLPAFRIGNKVRRVKLAEVERISRQLGHRDSATTRGIYLHPSADYSAPSAQAVALRIVRKG